jgi:hypothetical protein
MTRFGMGIIALATLLAACSDDTTSTQPTNNVTTNNATNNATNNMTTLSCVDSDNDGALAGDCAEATDCDDNDKTRYPGATEVCGDRKDNNCDGVLDDGCPCLAGSTRLCSATIDPNSSTDNMPCRPGLQGCIQGAWDTECVGEVGPNTELCDGIDNNCDGSVDEGLLNPIGQCLADFPNVPDESCGPTGEGNGLDDDGDGLVDEDCSCVVPAFDPDLPRKNQPCYSGTPATLGVGLCKGGTRSCGGDGVWEMCTGDVKPVTEVCNDQLDNDCDGLVDEGCVVCTPAAEICDGIDNNCDGVIDEGVRNACGGCGAVADVETCDDGIDNDCNGQVDEGCGCTSATTQCFPGAHESAGVGACSYGTMKCGGEYYGACTGYTLPALEQCGPTGLGDGIDNNCDGQVDEGCGCTDGATRFCGQGSGTCAYGTQTCAAHQWGACTGGVGPATEICDGLDNDCDGLTDEDGLLNACGTCGLTCYYTGFDPTNPGFDNMLDGGEIITAADPDNPTGRAGVTLTKTTSFLPYLWVANSALNTVSKFNSVTETEDGRYFVGTNPSRTAIDLNGNAWVGGRNDGRLTQIISDSSSCPDKNLNGMIDTSTGTNLVNTTADYFADECVAYSKVLNPTQPSIRGVAVDPAGKIWVGYSIDGAGNGGVQSIDPNNNYAESVRYPIVNVPEYKPDANGNLVATGVLLNDDQVYGIAIDANGYLYAAVWSFSGVARFNTNTLQWDAFYTGLSCGPYGITVDGFNRAWAGCWNGDGGIAMVDSTNNKAYSFRVPANVGTPAAGTTLPIGTAASHVKWNSSAITIEPVSGDAYVTFTNGFIGRLMLDPVDPMLSQYTFLSGVRDPANTANRMANTGAGDMRGVGFDSDGYLWHLGIPTANILKFDVTNNTYLRMVSVGGGGHYTYSDFTGSAAFNFTAPRGFWRMTFDTSFEGARVDGVYMEAYVPVGTTVGIRVRAIDNAGAPLGDWQPATVNGSPQYIFYPPGAAMVQATLPTPLQGGSQFEVEVLMTTTDRDVRPILHQMRLDWQRP